MWYFGTLNFQTPVILFPSLLPETQWNLWESNPEPSGYEPDALTDCAKIPDGSLYDTAKRFGKESTNETQDYYPYRIRTCTYRDQNPMPYRLAKGQFRRFFQRSAYTM